MRQIPLDAIIDAARHVYKAAVRTPLVKLDLPFSTNDAAQPEVYLKLESLQPIGSFKIRGAWNAVRKLTAEQMKDGVWTVSAGNAPVVDDFLRDLREAVSEIGGARTDDRGTEYATLE